MAVWSPDQTPRARRLAPLPGSSPPCTPSVSSNFPPRHPPHRPTRRPPCPRPHLASDAVGSAFRRGPPGSFRNRPATRPLQCTQRTKRSSNESSAWIELRLVPTHSVATELRSPPLFNRRDAPNPRSNRPAWSCSTPRRRFRPRPYTRTAGPLPLAADLPDFSPPSRCRDRGS